MCRARVNARSFISGGIALAILGAGCAASSSAADLRILLPLYAHPAWWDSGLYVWDDVAAANSRAPITAIINPNNGPDGGPPDEDYTRGLSDLRAGGVTILGYVYTSYALRDATAVKADIDLYATAFDVDGIFLDEVSTSTNDLAYYADLHTYIHAKTNLHQVVTNPGTKCPEAYLTRPATDTAVIYEDGTGWSSYAPDGYVARYPPTRFAALIHNTASAETMRTNVDLAVRRNIGYVYVTNDGLPDPWDTLPSYWNELVDYVSAYRSLQVRSLAMAGPLATLDFSTLSNRPCRAEWNSSLTDSVWSALTPATLTTGLQFQARDTNTAGAARFYRLKMFP